MNKSKKNKIIIIFLVAVIIISTLVIFKRNSLFNKKPSYEILVKHEDLIEPKEEERADLSYSYDFLSHKEKSLEADNLTELINNIPNDHTFLFPHDLSVKDNNLSIIFNYVGDVESKTAADVEMMTFLEKTSVVFYYLYPSLEHIHFDIRNGEDQYRNIDMEKEYINNNYLEDLNKFEKVKDNEFIYFFLKYN